jgi:hypothetical protein
LPQAFRQLAKIAKRVSRPQRGATGLEAAIIMVAFAGTAAIFAYVVLSTGMFASIKSHEAATAGLDQVSSSLDLVGDVKADGVVATTVSSVEGAGGWTASPNVTAATETSDYKLGSGGLKLTVAGAFTTGLVAYENLGATVDLSGHFSVGLWVKATGTIDANALRLVIDDSAGCGSPEETLNIPALTADSWLRHRINVSDAIALSAIACVGISAASDPGAVTLYVDHIEGPAEVQSIHVAMENAIPTHGIALVTTADSDSDGVLSDEATKTHFLIITYMSDDTVVRDLAWTTSELGLGDGDNTLEAGETFILNIDLRAVDPVPTTRSLITLDIASNSDGSIVLEKVVPPQITPSMVLH